MMKTYRIQKGSSRGVGARLNVLVYILPDRCGAWHLTGDLRSTSIPWPAVGPRRALPSGVRARSRGRDRQPGRALILHRPVPVHGVSMGLFLYRRKLVLVAEEDWRAFAGRHSKRSARCPTSAEILSRVTCTTWSTCGS